MAHLPRDVDHRPALMQQQRAERMPQRVRRRLRHPAAEAAVQELTVLEAEDTLAFIARRREQDPVIDAFENAPLDDEPITRKKSWASDEARETYRRGETKRDRSSVHLL